MKLRASWEVRAGVIPGQAIREYTRRWDLTSAQWEEDQTKSEGDPAYHCMFSKMRSEALDYHSQISMPNLNNWAELTFLWY